MQYSLWADWCVYRGAVVAKLSDEIAHILFHVEAEAAGAAPNQVSGVAARAQAVRDLVASWKTDSRQRTRKQLLTDMKRDVLDAELQTELEKLNPDDDGQKLRRALATWVGEGTMFPTS